MSIKQYIVDHALRTDMHIAANTKKEKKLEVVVRMFEDGTVTTIFTVTHKGKHVISTPHILLAAETYDAI